MDIREAITNLFSKARTQAFERPKFTKHPGSKLHKDKKKRRAKQKSARASRKRNRRG